MSTAETSAHHPAKRTAAQSFSDRYGPWAVVTGASSGIGREFALELAARGLDLVLHGRDPTRLEAVACLIESSHGRRVLRIHADLAEPRGIESVIETMAGVDVGLVIANAGLGVAQPFMERSTSGLEEVLAVNCRALLRLSQAAALQMQPRGGGGLVLVGSLVGFQGVPLMADYAASKAYVQALGEGLHLELRPAGIDVLVTAPGPTRSGFGERAGLHMGRAASASAVARRTLDALGRSCTVRPGWLAWFLGTSLAPLPRLARSRILGRVMRGMAAGA
jgi:uncharacterized protein